MVAGLLGVAIIFRLKEMLKGENVRTKMLHHLEDKYVQKFSIGDILCHT